MKYNKYDHVQIKEMPNSRFPNNTDAIVLYSDNSRYGTGEVLDNDCYCLWVNGHGEVSWYYPESLTLIEHDRKDLLDKWKIDKAERISRESDLDWIFKNGKKFVETGKIPGLSAQALWHCIFDESKPIWGSHGEGIVYYLNGLRIFQVAKPFLETGDKAGWIQFCNEQKMLLA